ncbi:MAG: hypothetical protein AMXMBFR13_08560 [Phycisphaerae bacterium]
MSTTDDELQQRVCRSCNVTYDYPELKSEATRFYCAGCMDLDPRVRAKLEAFNKRIKTLSTAVQKLEQQLKKTPAT